MQYAMQKYATNRLIRTHARGVFTFGATQPVLTVLDVRGFELTDLFLIGLNDDCGSIVLPTESRAENAAAALEPAYATVVKPFGPTGQDWCVEYSRRDLDGSEPSRFVTEIVLKDGTVAMKNGRWIP